MLGLHARSGGVLECGEGVGHGQSVIHDARFWKHPGAQMSIVPIHVATHGDLGEIWGWVGGPQVGAACLCWVCVQGAAQ